MSKELKKIEMFTFDPSETGSFAHPDRYQDFAQNTVIFMPEPRLPFLALGVTGEAGEVADKVKKGMRGDYDINSMTEEQRKAIALELGDTLWYMSNMAHELGFTLSDIMRMNVEKLVDRRARGAIHGDGDNR